MSAILLEKQFLHPIQKSEKMTDYYYKVNDFIRAAPLLIVCVLLVILVVWFGEKTTDATFENTAAITSLQATIISMKKDMEEHRRQVDAISRYVAEIAEQQNDFLTIVRENNNSIRILEQHPLLRDDYDDYGRKSRRAQ